MELKNFVDFAYSLINMDEYKDGIFPLPKEIVFELKSDIHSNIHKKIKKEKNDNNLEDLEGDFEVDIFGINFYFKKVN